MHKNGDRVLVPRGDYWYPATIRHVEGDRFFAICDDGEDGFFAAQQMTALNLGIGGQVFVRLNDCAEYQPARILDLQGNRLQVELAGQPPAWVPLGQVRLAPTMSAGDDVLSSTPHEIGARVFACGLDLCWYPGIVLGEHDGRWKVLFDFGGLTLVPGYQVRPLTLAEGDRIQCRWQGREEFFAGRITRTEGEIIDIRYDDDDWETTSIRLIRLVRDDWLPPAQAYELGPGDRMLGCWFDQYWYPGIILSLEGRRIHVLFDDNDQAFLTWDRVRPMDIEVGDRVTCRFKGGRFYVPGEVCRRKDERILVRYDDGQEEWTSIRLLRLEG